MAYLVYSTIVISFTQAKPAALLSFSIQTQCYGKSLKISGPRILAVSCFRKPPFWFYHLCIGFSWTLGGLGASKRSSVSPFTLEAAQMNATHFGSPDLFLLTLNNMQQIEIPILRKDETEKITPLWGREKNAVSLRKHISP